MRKGKKKRRRWERCGLVGVVCPTPRGGQGKCFVCVVCFVCLVGFVDVAKPHWGGKANARWGDFKEDVAKPRRGGKANARCGDLKSEKSVGLVDVVRVAQPL